MQLTRNVERSESLSARRAWIEMFVWGVSYLLCCTVALRKESVDRNSGVMRQNPGKHVALRKESVDRNNKAVKQLAKDNVALRKESVDRNSKCCFVILLAVLVALRKESVDRNVGDGLSKNDITVSLSARRAWIEIISALV